MVTYVLYTGPLVASVDAHKWATYKSGVMSTATCAGYGSTSAIDMEIYQVCLRIGVMHYG